MPTKSILKDSESGGGGSDSLPHTHMQPCQMKIVRRLSVFISWEAILSKVLTG